MVVHNGLVKVLILVLAFFYNPGPGDIPYYGCEGGCKACPDFSLPILGYSGPVDPVPCCEFCCKLVPTTPAPDTCKPDSNVCSTKSHIGYQLSYYEYFAGSQSVGKGGAAHYCPKGTGGYGDCKAACNGEVNLDKCVSCCTVCCKPDAVKTRAFDDDDEDFAAFLHDGARNQYNHDHR